jgi:hypothetical protein
MARLKAREGESSGGGGRVRGRGSGNHTTKNLLIHDISILP